MSRKPYKHPLPIIATPQKVTRWEFFARIGVVAFLVAFWYIFITLVQKALG